jgi:hypothetical protein
LEHYPDEICDSVSLSEFKQLCAELRLDAFELLDIDCAFCKSKKFEGEFSLPRNELLEYAREKGKWSRDNLGDRANLDDAEIAQLESNPDHIEKLCISDVKQLSNELKVPLQLLMDLRCPRCDR